ncbi:MAG: TM2 domain-containing protein [Alphaproteobacteria bacterium]|nr:TM2 domain-containing protein [Alphaproteobacteria bacterium]
MANELVRSPQRREVGTAYALWALSFVLLPGIHRFYLGRPASGIIWLLTGGLCGVGTIIDAIFLPRMVEDSNAGRGW